MSIELVLIPVAIAITQSIGSHVEKKLDSKIEYHITTIMKDKDLVKKALENYGCNPNFIGNDEITSEIGESKILFLQNSEGVIDAYFDNEIPLDSATEFLNNIQEEYTSIVQQETYLRLLERAKEKGMILETEEITNSNSIVLTFKIN